jgi:hypothetical protein
MTATSATYIYGEPGQVTHVAVFGGDAAQARRHASAAAGVKNATASRPEWTTEPQLNGGKPFRLYPLRYYPADRISTAPEPPIPSSGMSPTTAHTDASSRSGETVPSPGIHSVH